MKVAAALIALLAVSGIALFFQQSTDLTNESQVFEQYQAWKQSHNMKYSTQQDTMRFQNFLENYNFVKTFNAENNFTLGVSNQFAALSNAEFRAIYTNEQIRNSSKRFTVQSTTEEVSAYPTDSVNWVQKGAVYDIQNQGQCGSCWAFSAVSSLESLYYLDSGNLENFSEQQVVSCDTVSYGCNGGWPEAGFKYAATNGLTLADNYPYVQLNNGNTAACNTAKIVNPTKVNTSYGNISANSPAAMVTQLMKQPLSVLVDGGSIVFQLYNGGIVDSAACGTSLDHAINAVAYDGEGVWTLRNSWGTTWGESGYMRVQYTTGAGYCGMNSSPSYPTNN